MKINPLKFNIQILCFIFILPFVIQEYKIIVLNFFFFLVSKFFKVKKIKNCFIIFKVVETWNWFET